VLLARGYLSEIEPQITQVCNQNDTGVWTYETQGQPGLAVCVVGHTIVSCEGLWRRYRQEVLEDPTHFFRLKKKRISVA